LTAGEGDCWLLGARGRDKRLALAGSEGEWARQTPRPRCLPSRPNRSAVHRYPLRTRSSPYDLTAPRTPQKGGTEMAKEILFGVHLRPLGRLTPARLAPLSVIPMRSEGPCRRRRLECCAAAGRLECCAAAGRVGPAPSGRCPLTGRLRRNLAGRCKAVFRWPNPRTKSSRWKHVAAPVAPGPGGTS